MNHFFKVEKTRCTIWCTLYYTSQIGHFYAFWISFVLRLLCQSSCSRNRGLSVFKLFFPLHMSLSVSNLQFCALVSFHTSQRCPSVSFCFVIFFYPPPLLSLVKHNSHPMSCHHFKLWGVQTFALDCSSHEIRLVRFSGL